MGNDIKSLLDDIINSTNNSFENNHNPHEHSHHHHHNHNDINPIEFDANKYCEKISLCVLKDLICAMMHNETKDVDHMIDSSIIQHIQKNYNGTCYGYLCDARNRLMSPLIDEIIQEIDNKTNDVAKKLNETKDEEILNEKINVKEILKNTNNYPEFLEKITKKTTNDVINDVADVIAKSTNAPVFDNLDEEISNLDKTTNESVILKICGSIVTESYVNKKPISTEEGLNRAILEYCIYKMDYLFKAQPKESIFTKYM